MFCGQKHGCSMLHPCFCIIAWLYLKHIYTPNLTIFFIHQGIHHDTIYEVCIFISLTSCIGANSCYRNQWWGSLCKSLTSLLFSTLSSLFCLVNNADISSCLLLLCCGNIFGTDSTRTKEVDLILLVFYFFVLYYFVLMSLALIGIISVKMLYDSHFSNFPFDCCLSAFSRKEIFKLLSEIWKRGGLKLIVMSVGCQIEAVIEWKYGNFYLWRMGQI